jgi:hypothetical protein
MRLVVLMSHVRPSDLIRWACRLTWRKEGDVEMGARDTKSTSLQQRTTTSQGRYRWDEWRSCVVKILKGIVCDEGAFNRQSSVEHDVLGSKGGLLVSIC